MRFLIIPLFFTITLHSMAQSNLVVFSEQGERFALIVNGVNQTENYQTNAKITGLPAPSYRVKIIFENKTIKDIDKTLYFNEPNHEYTYSLVNKEGNYKLRFNNMYPLNASSLNNVNQETIIYSETPKPLPSVTVTTVHNTTQITQTTSGAGGVGHTESNQSTTQVSTMVTTTTTSVAANLPVVQEPVKPIPGYNGPIGCENPMDNNSFLNLKHSIEKKDFEDAKLSVAKQAATSNCLLASQVKEILLLFSFENSKIAFAKHCYARTWDQGNYFVIHDAFDFESSIDELNKFIGVR